MTPGINDEAYRLMESLQMTIRGTTGALILENAMLYYLWGTICGFRRSHTAELFGVPGRDWYGSEKISQ